MKSTLVLSTLLMTLGIGCGSPPSSSLDADRFPARRLTLPRNGPVTCSIQTNNGRYLTAVGGGGRTTDVLHTDATRVGAWEKFTLVDSGAGTPLIRYGIKTVKGNYLTAVGGGGRITDVIHSDATRLAAWETFTLIPLAGGIYAIQTINGRYLTATGGGGQINDAIHSDATVVKAWEKFRLNCGI